MTKALDPHPGPEGRSAGKRPWRAEKIILASASPRRREMLERTGLPFRVVPPRVDERSWLAHADRNTAGELARLKALEVAGRLDRKRYPWIIAADTVVEASGRILGQPESPEQADAFLRLLSGRRHQVHTGLALCAPSVAQPSVKIVTTQVSFRLLTAPERAYYIASGEWRGAAGGYRIQERGGFFVDKVDGSYSNVVGLPLETLYEMLKAVGYQFLA